MTWGGRIELFGSLIIGVFVMDQELRVSVVVIWNWTTGQELTRLIVKYSDHRVRHRQTRIFDFLSDNTFVICRQFGPTETLAQGLPEDTFGLLEIYKFDPLAPSPALHVASLALPAGTIKDERNITAVYFSFSLYLPPSLQPQVWGISPNTRLICVSINGTLQWENVCVQAQTLLKYAGTASNGIVRWDEWGPETVWDKWNGPISRCSHVTTHDQRLVSMKSLWIAQEIEVNLFELERTKDSQIVPVLKAELAFGPKRRSKRNGGEKPMTGPQN